MQSYILLIKDEIAIMEKIKKQRHIFKVQNNGNSLVCLGQLLETNEVENFLLSAF